MEYIHRKRNVWNSIILPFHYGMHLYNFLKQLAPLICNWHPATILVYLPLLGMQYLYWNVVLFSINKTWNTYSKNHAIVVHNFKCFKGIRYTFKTKYYKIQTNLNGKRCSIKSAVFKDDNIVIYTCELRIHTKIDR